MMALPMYSDEKLGEIAKGMQFMQNSSLCILGLDTNLLPFQKNSRHTFEIKRDRTCGFPQGMFILYLQDRCDTRHYPMTMSAIGTATRMLVSERVDIV